MPRVVEPWPLAGRQLADVVRHELAPYATAGNTTVDGPDVVLRPEATQAVVMVLHELVTNAAKYGALSTSNGQVSVRWERRLNGNPLPEVMIEWLESGGPLVVVPVRQGYGTSVIRDLIPYELSGTVDLAYAASGVRCKIEIPFEQATSSDRSADQFTGSRSLLPPDAGSPIAIFALNGFCRVAVTFLCVTSGTA